VINGVLRTSVISTTCEESSSVSSARRLLPVCIVNARGPTMQSTCRCQSHEQQVKSSQDLLCLKAASYCHTQRHLLYNAASKKKVVCAVQYMIACNETACWCSPGSKHMAAPASLATCMADFTRLSGSSSNTNPLVNTAAVDCRACQHAHNTKHSMTHVCVILLF